jgi:type I restriction enzyme S subunit
MSEIKKLIEKLCPEGVEYKRLGDLTEILRGRRLTKKELTDNAEYPVYHGGIEPIGYYSHHNRPANTVMIINVGASAGTVGYCNKPFWSSDGCYCIDKSELLSDRYLYYVLSKNQLAFVSKVRHAGIPTLDSKVIANFEIPVPPIEVQRKIVEILDNFTELEIKLEAELEARRKQYEYYRNQLLTFDKVGGGKI